MPYNFTTIEKKWQQYWLDHKSFAATDPADAGAMPKAYVLDMFPYPSGAGLHVGHPEGYTATDIVSRHLRMKGYNVLHPMGWDAFGLPAEQHAMSTGEHPAINTQKNVDNFRRQIRMLGLSYDWDREVNTTDPKYYRWTQWIFLQLFNSYFDPVDNKAKPIAHLADKLENENLVAAPDGSIHLNPNPQGMSAIAGDVGAPFLKWADLPPDEKRDIINGQRLAYTDEVAVNWCPGLGTVLANEEVIDGRSERGNYPVERRPMRQWLLRITAYADRLLSDLDLLEWPESLKEMQRNWIGKSVGANVEFDLAPSVEAGLPASAGSEASSEASIEVFTTRPDTLFGATYLVLAPEHPLVELITMPRQREEVAAYRAEVAAKSERDRMAETKDKTGAFTGAFAINPVNGEKVPIWVADYVLMGYGTGAIMAVPAHDERDFEFARKFNLPIRAVVQPTDEWLRDKLPQVQQMREKFAQPRSLDAGAKIHITTVEAGDVKLEEQLTPEEWASMLPELGRTEPIRALMFADEMRKGFTAIAELLREKYVCNAGFWPSAYTGDGVAINSGALNGLTTSAAKEKIIEQLEADGSGSRAVTYKLRDWLFSRQRYWGEPFPILLDAQQNPYPVPESDLPVALPPMADFRPTGTPEPPLSKAKEWLTVKTDAGVFTRETNTMPQWAGSCWYYLRYIDPNNDARFVDPEKEKYWMPVDLYVGGVEHAVLHLLYARFWHKVLFDLGHVSTPEPFRRLVNQGLILGEMEFHVFADQSGNIVSLPDVRDINDEATEDGVRMIATHRTAGEKLIGRRLTEEQVEKVGDGYHLRADPSVRVDARSFKMSKSRGNVVNPDDIVKDYGADTFRLYEMYMGPLEAQKPWNTRDIIGMSRFLNAVWRNLVGDEEKDRTAIIDPGPIPDALDRQLHRAIKKVGEDIAALRFNTAIAELIKLNNEMTGLKTIPRALAENFILLLAPFAPHIAEEIWQRLGKPHSLARHPWPAYDETKLIETTIELPVQVNGKLRGKLTVTPDAPKESILAAARAVESVRPWMDGKTVKKEIYVPGKLVSFVVG